MTDRRTITRLAEALFRRDNEGSRCEGKPLRDTSAVVQAEYERDAVVLTEALAGPTPALRNEIDIACPRCGGVEVLRLDVRHVTRDSSALRVIQFNSQSTDHTCPEEAP